MRRGCEEWTSRVPRCLANGNSTHAKTNGFRTQDTHNSYAFLLRLQAGTEGRLREAGVYRLRCYSLESARDT